MYEYTFEIYKKMEIKYTITFKCVDENEANKKADDFLKTHPNCDDWYLTASTEPKK